MRPTCAVGKRRDTVVVYLIIFIKIIIIIIMILPKLIMMVIIIIIKIKIKMIKIKMIKFTTGDDEEEYEDKGTIMEEKITIAKKSLRKF